MAANPASPFPANQVDTSTLTPTTVTNPADALYPPQGPNPPGTRPAEAERTAEETLAHPAGGTGVEGEEVVWEAGYSLWNFVGRLTTRALLTLAWVGLAVYTWGMGHRDLNAITIVLGIVLGVLWLALFVRMVQARGGHYYRLTTRRLFVSTGLIRRRRDQLELLRVEDVYTRQSFFDRWLGLGTVVVVSSEKSLPSVAMPGVEDPKRVMDLVWHHARAERDQRSVKVQEI